MQENDNITETSRQFAENYHKVFANDLISVILYGSALTTEYISKKSDLNFLIILSEGGVKQLHLAFDLVARWRNKKVSTPLFLTKAYIESSLDTFPIEFINIKQNYRVIFGKDILEGLSFDKNFVRLQCEREVKGKLLLLRERYIETRGRAKALNNLITATVPTFIFIFNGILYLLDKKIPATKHETAKILAEELNLDKELFLFLLQAKTAKRKYSAEEIDIIFQKYLKEIRSLAMLIDGWGTDRKGLNLYRKV